MTDSQSSNPVNAPRTSDVASSDNAVPSLDAGKGTDLPTAKDLGNATPAQDTRAKVAAVNTSSTLASPSASAPQKTTASVWVVSLIALAVACVATGTSFVVWREIATVRLDAQQRTDAVLAQTKTAASEAQTSQALALALQGRMSVAEAKLSELNLQRTQLEELMLSVSRSRDDTLVQDLESSIRFALQQSHLMGSPNALIATLQAGIERINRSAQPRLNAVLQAMEADLLRLQEVAGADVPMLVAQLAQLTSSIDALPLRAMTPPLPHKVANQDVPVASAIAPPTADPLLVDGPSAASSGWLSDTWRGISAQARALWRDWAGVASQQLSGLVRVRAIDNSDVFLLSPEHAWMLRENLKLRVLNARLALVGGQHDIAAQDLAAVAQSITQYGEPGASDVQALLERLQRLQANIQGLQVPMPQSTLGALVTAAQGR